MNQADRMLFHKSSQYNEEKEENLVDVTGIEPVTLLAKNDRCL
jgi:hypothetical protein